MDTPWNFMEVKWNSMELHGGIWGSVLCLILKYVQPRCLEKAQNYFLVKEKVFLLMESVQIYPCGVFWRTPEDLISASFRLKIGHFEISTTETDHIIFVEDKRLLTRTISSDFLSTNVTCRQGMKKKKKKRFFISCSVISMLGIS